MVRCDMLSLPLFCSSCVSSLFSLSLSGAVRVEPEVGRHRRHAAARAAHAVERQLGADSLPLQQAAGTVRLDFFPPHTLSLSLSPSFLSLSLLLSLSLSLLLSPLSLSLIPFLSLSHSLPLCPSFSLLLSLCFFLSPTHTHLHTHTYMSILFSFAPTGRGTHPHEKGDAAPVFDAAAGKARQRDLRRPASSGCWPTERLLLSAFFFWSISIPPPTHFPQRSLLLLDGHRRLISAIFCRAVPQSSTRCAGTSGLCHPFSHYLPPFRSRYLSLSPCLRRHTQVSVVPHQVSVVPPPGIAAAFGMFKTAPATAQMPTGGVRAADTADAASDVPVVPQAITVTTPPDAPASMDLG